MHGGGKNTHTHTHMYTRACAHVCCCTNDSTTVHSLYNELCFLDYQLPYGAQYLQSRDCLLRTCPTAAGDRACHRFRPVAQGACTVQCSKCLTTTEPQHDPFTTVKTSNTAQTLHLATYKTTAHRRCVNMQFNDDCRFLVIMPCSLLQISRRLHGVTFTKADITHK